MCKRKTTEEFIKQAKEVHGENTYDYSLVEYINHNTKVKIICPIHGIFLQSPLKHVQNRHCPLCSNKNNGERQKSTLDEFIQKAQEIHGIGIYNYDLVEYKGCKDKIKIICPIHGVFVQTPSSHINGNGCRLCANLIIQKSRSSNTEDFLKKVKEIHGDEYDYSKSIYISCNKKIIIICKKHGEFLQTPSSHLSGSGCPICKPEKTGEKLSSTKEEFIKRAITVHGSFYNYTDVEYINKDKKVKIICPLHGEFFQQPGHHLLGNKCAHCSNTVSRISKNWLDSLDIPNDPQHREVKYLIKVRRFIVDGYIPETNTIYEFYGDKVHGNPNKYNLDDINSITKKPFRENYRKTMEREQIFRDAGYNIISIWESDYKQQRVEVAKLLI